METLILIVSHLGMIAFWLLVITVCICIIYVGIQGHIEKIEEKARDQGRRRAAAAISNYSRWFAGTDPAARELLLSISTEIRESGRVYNCSGIRAKYQNMLVTEPLPSGEGGQE